jgi:uncharacterized membrane protein YphA (DoxX/SURF4 family)
MTTGVTAADPTANGRLQRTWQRRAVTVACWILAFSFVGGGITKYMPGETFFGPAYAEKFSDWGYPSWFRFVVGTAELVAAALLVMPRRRVYGAAILIVVLLGAVITHIANQDPLSESVAAPVNLVIVLAIAWSTGPHDLRQLRPGRLRRA